MRGWGIRALKKDPVIIPLYVIMAGALAWMTYSSVRCAVKNPEVSFNRKGNPEPWNAYRHKQYKLWHSDKDFKFESQAPDYLKKED